MTDSLSPPICEVCRERIAADPVIAYGVVRVETEAVSERLLGNPVTFHIACFQTHVGEYAITRQGEERCGHLEGDDVCVHVPHDGADHLYEALGTGLGHAPVEIL